MTRFRFPKLCLLVSAMLLTLTAGSVDAGVFDDPGVGRSDRGGHSNNELPRFYGSAEYLLWQTTGTKLPPLVTGNPLGTPAAEAGVIGVPSTQILLGNQTIFDDARSGFRTTLGVMLCDRVGFEANYFGLADEEASYRFDGSSNLILGRPFINLDLVPNRWDTQLFEFPADNVSGSLDINAYSKFQGGGVGFRINVLSPTPSCGCGPVCDGNCDSLACGTSVGLQHTLSLYMGYRHLNLDEGINFREVLVNPADRFEVEDDFQVSSRFHGIELGMNYEAWHCNVGLSTFGRIGVGNNRNEVGINGSTVIDGVLQTAPGGILTQTSNIGQTSHDVAAMTAQFGFNLHAQLFPWMHANAGYSGMYWGNVVRAGEQIDSRLHPDLFPPPVAAAGTIGAQRTGATNDFFAHGLNVGLTISL